jgi:hypothetical protein
MIKSTRWRALNLYCRYIASEQAQAAGAVAMVEHPLYPEGVKIPNTPFGKERARLTHSGLVILIWIETYQPILFAFRCLKMFWHLADTALAQFDHAAVLGC